MRSNNVILGNFFKLDARILAPSIEMLFLYKILNIAHSKLIFVIIKTLINWGWVKLEYEDFINFV